MIELIKMFNILGYFYYLVLVFRFRYILGLLGLKDLEGVGLGKVGL